HSDTSSSPVTSSSIQSYLTPPHLPSFPTRRSSDLELFGQIASSRGELTMQFEMRTFLHESMSMPSRFVSIFTFSIVRLSTPVARDRKSTRLNSSHVAISYAVFCLKKKNIYSQTVNS